MHNLNGHLLLFKLDDSPLPELPPYTPGEPFPIDSTP